MPAAEPQLFRYGLEVQLEIEIIPSLAPSDLGVEPAEWNALCSPNDPFMEHGFLRLLEESRSVGPAESGWLPRHVVVKRAGKLVAAMPLYLKHHSYGEFIFDFGWAQAALRAGLPYYPKLISAAPFTPAGGRRLLVRPEDEAELLPYLVAAAREVAVREEASSVHVLFCTEGEALQLAEQGMHARHSTQYHFQNHEQFTSFADFQGALRNSSRKAVRKEREKAQ